MSAISEIYDQLFLFESAKKDHPFPVHKKLKLPGGLLQFIEERVGFRYGETILDAGCGNGHTLFWLNESYECSGTGVSLSEREIEFANQYARKKGKARALSFEYKSYDEPFATAFDKILAIESLKHSTNLKVSIENLIKSLASEGILIIADDFIVHRSKTIESQSKHWAADGFVSLQEFIKLVEDKSDKYLKINIFTLTDYVPTRPKALLHLLIASTRLLNKVINKRNFETYLGGLQLELSYARKDVQYEVLLITQ